MPRTRACPATPVDDFAAQHRRAAFRLKDGYSLLAACGKADSQLNVRVRQGWHINGAAALHAAPARTFAAIICDKGIYTVETYRWQRVLIPYGSMVPRSALVKPRFRR